MKYTVAEIYEIVEQEGLGQAVNQYVSADRIADPVLSTLWEDTKALLEQIETYLEENHNEPFDLSEEDEEDYE